MASYSKQMIEIAKQWLAVNTDPASPFLTIPRRTANLNYEGELRKLTAGREQVIKSGRSKPELLGAYNRLEENIHEAMGIVGELRDLETDVEQRLNSAPDQKHEKHGVDRVLHSDLGRWCLAWARHGYNVFDLSADFTAAMLLTDPRGIDIDRVRLPFNGLLVLIPDGFARGQEGGHYTKIHITELTYGDVNQLKVANEISDTISGLSPAQQQSVLDDVRTKLDAHHAQSNGPVWQSAPGLYGSQPIGVGRPRSLVTRDRQEVTHLHIYATDGVHVLSTMIERNGLTWDSFDDLPSEVDFTADLEAMQTIRRVVFGALAYCTAVPTAVTPADGARAPRVANSDPVPKRWEVGRTIKIDQNLVRSVRAGSREVALRMKSRWIVRGHYHNYRVGPGRTGIKNSWTAPYYKGPIDGAEFVHTYKLENDNTGGT